MVVVGCGRVGSGLAVGLAQQGHSVAIMDKVARSFRRLPGRLAGHHGGGLGLRPRRPRPGRGDDGRRPGRGDERRQLQHPDGPDRPGELRDRQRGGPDLRPPAGRDLPAPGHPHRGHGDVDHRPGPAAAAAGDGHRGVDRRHRTARPRRARPARGLGRQAPLRPRARGPGQPGGGDPGRGAPAGRGRHGRPGRRRPPRGRDEGRHGRPGAPDRHRDPGHRSLSKAGDAHDRSTRR